MKKVFLCLLLMPFAGIGRFDSSSLRSKKPVEIRSGDWPIILERSINNYDTSYSIQFRDMQVSTSSVLDTLALPDLTQLKYFEKALTTLKAGSTGDMARFKNYSLTRTDKKNEGTWYILRLKWTLTDFKQSEADLLVKTIRGLQF
jgi:hypothetical protein